MNGVNRFKRFEDSVNLQKDSRGYSWRENCEESLEDWHRTTCNSNWAYNKKMESEQTEEEKWWDSVCWLIIYFVFLFIDNFQCEMRALCLFFIDFCLSEIWNPRKKYQTELRDDFWPNNKLDKYKLEKSFQNVRKPRVQDHCAWPARYWYDN